MTGVEKMNRYIADVKSGKILTNRYVKLAIKRHEDDLKKSKKKDFPYRFDEEKANRFVQFCELLKQYKDEFKGKPLILEDWEAFCMCQIYGWVYKDTGYRKYRKAFLFVARKNGKTALVATTLLYDLLTTPGGEIYCVATKRDQAKICYNFAKEMVKQNSALSQRLKIFNSTNRIVYERNASFLEALAADSDKLDGLGSSCVVCDEVSAMKNYDIIKVLASGQGARPEPLMIEITSGSDDMYSAGKQEFDRSKSILEGVVKDDSFFCILYCLDDGDDWKNPKNFIKANPNLNVSVKETWLLKQLLEATQQPSLEGEFRTKNLGQYISPITAWVQPKIWTKAVENASKIKFTKSKGYFALGALDLSKRTDLSAFTVCIYQDGKFFLKHKAYFPAEMMAEKLKTDNELWRKWTEDGVLTATPGGVINYQYIFKDIMDAYEEYHLDSILFDPYASCSLIVELQDNIDLVEVPQSIKNLSPFVKRFEEEIYKGNIVDDNPLMRWEMSNAEVYRDPNDNLKIIKPDSRSSGKRIDNVITSLMAVGRIGQLLDNGEIDTRTPEEAGKQTEAFLKNLNLFG